MSHIERLLLMHDCVIIPKVGGFVLQNYPASYNPVDHSFSPSGKEIVFNPESKPVQDYLISAYNKYIDMGVDAFRIDTVKHVSRNTFNRRSKERGK
jgi:glycosidase